MQHLRIVMFAIAAIVHGVAQAQCIASTTIGFPHASAQRYPSNLRGVLFMVPESLGLNPADFEVSASGLALAPALIVTPLEVARPGPVANDLPRGARLFRLELAGGFTPGITYSLRYRRAPDYRPVYPLEARFTVDRDALDLSAAGLALSFRGPAGQRQQIEWEGDAGNIYEAAVRDVALVLPDTLTRYTPAISVFYETSGNSRNQGTGFAPLHPESGSCAGKRLGGPENGRDVVAQQCFGALAPVRVRAWIGMLEVDDRLVPTGPLLAEWGADIAAACREVIERPRRLDRAQ
ncbi:MAG: hypothetical protein ABIT83_10625 [Massilia sp.]